MLVKGWYRGWNMCCSIENFTCVGAHRDKHMSKHRDVSIENTLNGVLIPVDEISEELQKREQNYRFVKLSAKDVFHWHASETNSLLEELHDANIWLCEVNHTGIADQCRPIYQSYVDTCLEGCLSHFGKDFALAFIKNTYGWDSHWVDDRESPQYPRLSTATSEIKTVIDELLHTCDLLQHRKPQKDT